MKTELPLPSLWHAPDAIAGFLAKPEIVRAEAVWAGIQPEYSEMIVLAAAELRQRPERLADLVRCATTLHSPEDWRDADWKDTPRDDSLGERFFMIFPILQQLANMRAIYAERKIPEKILLDTLADFQIWIETRVQRTGLPGFREAGWMREHINARVIRLGRLQFQPDSYAKPFVVLTNRQRHETCVVACGERRISTQGVFADSEGATGPSIELAYEEVQGEVRLGHCVQPNGYIATTPTQFAPGAWECRLAAGDPVLNLHIPAGAPLAFEACQDSFIQADDFYPRHFSDLPAAKAVVCGRWLLNPGLCEILPATANLVRFQKAFRRVPLPGAVADQTYERVFAPHGRDVRRAQVKTALQKKLFDHIAAGHIPLVAGAIFLAPLREWGGARS